MLVLTRKLQQQITIGDNVTVTVLRVKGNTVRLGIEAPREIRVTRNELPRKKADGLAVSEHIERERSVQRNEEEASGESVAAAENAAGDDAAGQLLLHLHPTVAAGSGSFESSPLAAHVAALCH